MGYPGDSAQSGRRTGRSGARFPSAELLETAPEPESANDPEGVEPDARATEDTYRLLVRPYVLTKGRTQTSKHYALETLITTRPGPAWSGVISNELHTVRELCVEPRSVAEVAALMSVPLGVARVLIGDMDDAGLVEVHASVATPEGRPDLDLMRRVLRGLHEL
ncbi:Protein of unknown function [Amycolatopsis marina]|uniref:DUF742 domain-containing protein n=1 Tax=Amycolatopsis marina TaxID=490629 RepID=A0A1I0VPB1_9PSEU|nr:DUF742 domain-containing protein [Amycolatopsis marina]SFA78048.1 Protein of unknown function [Amycolatopsis marina]